jgi:histidinol-phosphate phosphatase family protein
VLFDRDGTLIEDVPYNADPTRVRPLPGAIEAVTAVRARGFSTGVVTNQAGIGRGLLTYDDVRAVNAAVDELFGSFAVWRMCPHHPDENCACRKPRPGLVLSACAALGVRPAETVVVGDTGADVGAARAAGARAVLVPNQVTRPEEVRAAPAVATDLVHAVRDWVMPA